MPEENRENSQPRRGGRVLFINQSPESFGELDSRTVHSHARRWQTARKRQDQRDSAHQEAVYARSLVGWSPRNSSAPPSRTSVLRARPLLPSLTSDVIERRRDTSPSNVQRTTLPLQPTSGLRVDPFNSLPVHRTTDVMYMTDYFIHVWSMQKATHFDTLIGYNTYLNIYWPIALQDRMLFDATMAVSRAAWCLAQGAMPDTDWFVLRHRGSTMAKLRERISSAEFEADASMLFTMDHMVNIAYMTNEKDAFDIHWAAFRNAATRYIAAKIDDENASVVSHRLRSWEALDAYRKGVDLSDESLNAIDSLHRTLHSESYQHTQMLMTTYNPFTWPHHQSLSEAPCFVNLFHSNFSIRTLIDLAAELAPLLESGFQDFDGVITAGIIHRLTEIMTSENSSELETRICHALLAICYFIRPPGRHSLALGKIAQAFINKKFDLSATRGPERHCIVWCSLIIGSICLSIDIDPSTEKLDNITLQCLRSKGHVILVTLAQHFIQRNPAGQTQQDDDDRDFEQSWRDLQTGFLRQNFLCSAPLAAMWRRCWEVTVARQRDWENRGLLSVGAPRVADDAQQARLASVEYMVLRMGRDSLPNMEARVVS